MKLARYPLNTDGTPLDLAVGVLTDVSGNNGDRTPNNFGPDGSPIDAIGLILVDKTGAFFAPQNISEKGMANGYASLDVDGLVPLGQIPPTLIGSLNYKGVWNATTNTPAIPVGGASNKGHYYKVSVAGATSIDGINDWKIGDWIISNGATWDKVDNTDQVSTVNGQSGAVVLNKGDVGLGNVDNTSDANKPMSIPVQTALAAAGGSNLIGFTQNGLGAVLQTIRDKLRQDVSVKDFGAIGDGTLHTVDEWIIPGALGRYASLAALQVDYPHVTVTTDSIDWAAFQAAANAAKRVHVPAATYVINKAVNLPLNGASWYGDGVAATIISSTAVDLPMFTVTTGIAGLTFADMQLTRSVVANVGGYGFDCGTVSIGQSQLHRLLIQNQYIGMRLGPTDWSEVEDVIVQDSILDGIQMVNTATDGACQWSLDDTLSQRNGRHGYIFIATAGPSQVTLGTWTRADSYQNSGFGKGVLGLAGVPVHDIRWFGCFDGENGSSNAYLDTYGRNHIIDGCIYELAGRTATGPLSARVAASGVGSGIEVTTNNTNVKIKAVSDANSLDGFYVNALSNDLTGSSATNNGLALTAGRRNGVNSVSGRVVMVGGSWGNTGGATSQQYGAFVADGNNLTVGFADLSNNSVNAWGATANLNYVTSIGNLPNTLNVGLSPNGAVLVGGGATGDFNAAGTINLSGGLLKNDVAYTNP